MDIHGRVRALAGSHCLVIVNSFQRSQTGVGLGHHMSKTAVWSAALAGCRQLSTLVAAVEGLGQSSARAVGFLPGYASSTSIGDGAAACESAAACNNHGLLLP